MKTAIGGLLLLGWWLSPAVGYADSMDALLSGLFQAGSAAIADQQTGNNSASSTGNATTGSLIPVSGNPTSGGQIAPAGQLILSAPEASSAGNATGGFQSPEARSLLEALYQAVLGRGMDPSGATTWSNALAQGWTLGQVCDAIAQSAEAAGLIRALYHAYTGQELPADQIQAYKDYLRAYGVQRLRAHIEDLYIRDTVLPALHAVLPLLLEE